MLTNFLLYSSAGPMMLCIFIGAGTILWMMNKSKWYYGALGGLVAFVMIIIPFRPPADALPLNDAGIEALFQDQFLNGPHLHRHFLCDEETMIGLTADDPNHYLLLTRSNRLRPMFGSQKKAENCYRRNRRII
jgi:hypothetical protein